MRLFEHDGSESDMCGNGIRCIVLYLHRLTGLDEFLVETNSGIVSGRLIGENVLLNAGGLQNPGDFVVEEHFQRLNPSLLSINHNNRTFYILNIGEPHAVTIGDVDLREFVDFAKSGLFPRGINLNCITRLDSSRIRNRTFERGVWNYTTSCGTGSICCAVVARDILGCSFEKIIVENDIGQQEVNFVGREIHALARPQFLMRWEN